MFPTYKIINYKTYSVKTIDPESNKTIYNIYLTEETKDQLEDRLNIEINRSENNRFKESGFASSCQLVWEEKVLIKMIREKRKSDEEYQKQRQARYDKYILKRRSQ